MTSPASLRWRLRDATADAHARLDARVGAAFDDLPRYSAFLRGMKRFVAGAQQATGDAGALRGRAALRADLADLGVAPLPAAPMARTAPATATGWTYVLAGSSLGARLLLPRALRLGFDAGFGAQYLALQAGSGRWREFLAGLDPAPSEADAAAAVAGARTAFAWALDSMDVAFAEVPA